MRVYNLRNVHGSCFQVIIYNKSSEIRNIAYICHHLSYHHLMINMLTDYAEINLVSSISLLCFLNDLDAKFFSDIQMVSLDNVPLIIGSLCTNKRV